jgi:hypothetical protein
MQPIVVNPKTKSEMKFLSELLSKLGISSHVLTDDEMEDFGMSVLMKNADRTKKVSRDAVLKKLKS